VTIRVDRASLEAISKLPRVEQDRALSLIEEQSRRALLADVDLWERYDPVYYVRGEPSQITDWKHPAADYARIEIERAGRLQRLRSDPRLVGYMKAHYAEHPTDFIDDWGCTLDPRNADIDLPTLTPFILFPRQEEWVDYTIEQWQSRHRALTEKSRDSGVTWLAVALAATLCIFRKGMIVGFGSRVEDYVDKLGDPKSIFEKARIFLRNLPEEFRGGWVEKKHSFYMRIIFPENDALLVGEGGDNIGRGARTAIYFVDEAAHLERPLLAEASLSNTTNCRHDISTPHGLGNPFQQNRHSGRIKVFTMSWRDDPRKDDEWYAKQLEEAHSPAIVAQEIDIDYAASVEGTIIPAAWVRAAVDAHIKLGIEPSGSRRLGLDVADEGADRNAACVMDGIVVAHVEEWSGKGSDIFETVRKAFHICILHGVTDLRYDADGLGASVRGDARVLQEQSRRTRMKVIPFRGSGKVQFPDREAARPEKGTAGGGKRGPRNQDLYANLKAQGWWTLRLAFQATYRAVVEGMAYDPDEIISISSEIPSNVRSQLESELSQPTYETNTAGKIVVDKSPPGTKSPNMGDSVVIARTRLQGTRPVEAREKQPGQSLPAPLALPPHNRFGGVSAMVVTRNRFARAR
jgi:phage terminase large subunit